MERIQLAIDIPEKSMFSEQGGGSLIDLLGEHDIEVISLDLIVKEDEYEKR